jgi:3-oxoacyl-[acyl-carrier-protein] synthase II
LGFDENLVRLANGESGIKKIERFETERYAGLVELPNLRAFDRRLDFSGMNLISTYATIATKSALDDASVRMRRDISEDVGIAVSTCRGSSETAHMEGVFANEDRRGDIACFSNVTANSTAGWVSKALEIKGANITLASGQNSGLQTLAYASDIARSGEAKISLAVSADELYKQMIDSYEEIGNLHIGAVERDFHLNYSSYYKGVLGEGAVAVVVETMDNAVARGAKILGEVLAYSSTMDCVDFLEPNLTGVGLEQAVRNVLESAKLSSSDIDLVIWSPRGCAHDAPAILVRDKVLGKIPMLTTSLHTGYIETGSILHSLMCALKSFEKGLPLWKQRTGLVSFDDLPLPENPKKILCLASSHMGNNYAMIIGRD